MNLFARLAATASAGFLLFVAVVCFADGGNPQRAGQPSATVSSPETAPHNRYALLTGCTEYRKFNNPQFNDLRGPANDLALMRNLLTGKFKFRDGDITELSEAAAAKLGSKFLPIRENIAREFQELPKKRHLGPGDFVVILMSGHGCQQPETPQHDLRYAKPDGYDSIFLPEDIGRWDGKEHKVDRAIPDYELRAWTKSITATGASLWIIVDACCSGYTLREAGSSVARKVQPSQLGIPYEEMIKAYERARLRNTTRGMPEGRSSFELDGRQSPNFVGLYAAQPDEPTVELPLPEGAVRSPADRKVYGLLTYTICELLDKSATNLSYAELHRLICNSYDQSGHHAGPHPWLEGLAQNREVLGFNEPGRSRWLLQLDEAGNWSVNAGKLLGLTDDSILAVFPAANERASKQPLAYVKVVQSELLRASVVAWNRKNNKPAADTSFLKPNRRCEPVFIDFGSMRLSIAVDLAHAKSAQLVAKLRQIKQELADMHGRPMNRDAAVGKVEPQLFELVDEVNRAQWIVQERGGKIVLLDGHTAQIRDDSPLPTGVPSFDIPTDGTAPAELSRVLRQIFRGQNLLQLTKPALAADAPRRDRTGRAIDPSAIDVEVQMLKLNDENDQDGTPIKRSGGHLLVTPGMTVGWKVVNHGQTAVDVSLLFVGSDFEVVPVYPSRPGSDFDNWFPSGGERIVAKSQVTGDPLGDERMVLIVVPHADPPHNFAYLALSAADAAHSASRGADSEINSPLGRLCRYAMFGDDRGTRGLDLSSDETVPYQTGLLEWRVVAGNHAATGK